MGLKTLTVLRTKIVSTITYLGIIQIGTPCKKLDSLFQFLKKKFLEKSLIFLSNFRKNANYCVFFTFLDHPGKILSIQFLPLSLEV